VKAPLFWSLLGLAAFCVGVFGPNMEPFSRLWLCWPASRSLLITGCWLDNATLRVHADSTGLRSSSAIGWRQVRWDLVKSMELREITPTTYHLGGTSSRSPAAPPSPSSSRMRTGRTLLHMSTKMQPKEDVRRFFDLVRERTGLFPFLHNVEIPDSEPRFPLPAQFQQRQALAGQGKLHARGTLGGPKPPRAFEHLQLPGGLQAGVLIRVGFCGDPISFHAV